MTSKRYDKKLTNNFEIIGLFINELEKLFLDYLYKNLPNGINLTYYSKKVINHIAFTGLDQDVNLWLTMRLVSKKFWALGNKLSIYVNLTCIKYGKTMFGSIEHILSLNKLKEKVINDSGFIQRYGKTKFSMNKKIKYYQCLNCLEIMGGRTIYKHRKKCNATKKLYKCKQCLLTNNLHLSFKKDYWSGYHLKHWYDITYRMCPMDILKCVGCHKEFNATYFKIFHKKECQLLLAAMIMNKKSY